MPPDPTAARPTYWHGGQSGLVVGDHLLSPEETGFRHFSGSFMNADEMQRSGYRRDRVYLVTIRAAAVMYAALHPSGGCLYEVEPEGALEPDPDCTEPGMSWMCERARIVGVHRLARSERRTVNRAFGLPAEFRVKRRSRAAARRGEG